MKFTPGALLDGRKVVTLAGTREQLSTVTDEITSVTIVAETDNTGTIVVGRDTVVASLASRRGVPLNAGDAYTISVTQLPFIYLDTTVSGDGVTWTAEAVG
jgi:hypothetical protein